jgi:hypothetical protein
VASGSEKPVFSEKNPVFVSYHFKAGRAVYFYKRRVLIAQEK